LKDTVASGGEKVTVKHEQLFHRGVNCVSRRFVQITSFQQF